MIGIKVIPVDRQESNCHRGTDGCGLCDSLAGDYEIIEEKGTGSPKDTSRMLKAGAKKVYLLLADRNSLEKGMDAVFKIIPDNAMIIVESNTIRKVIEPGLFVVINKFAEASVKPSCAEVIGFADKIVGFDKMNWDFDPGRILVRNNSWIMME